jgi:hypothetical protein
VWRCLALATARRTLRLSPHRRSLGRSVRARCVCRVGVDAHGRASASRSRQRRFRWRGPRRGCVVSLIVPATRLFAAAGAGRRTALALLPRPPSRRPIDGRHRGCPIDGPRHCPARPGATAPSGASRVTRMILRWCGRDGDGGVTTSGVGRVAPSACTRVRVRAGIGPGDSREAGVRFKDDRLVVGGLASRRGLRPAAPSTTPPPPRAPRRTSCPAPTPNAPPPSPDRWRTTSG